MATHKKLLLSDLLYIARYYECDGPSYLSLQLALSKQSIIEEYNKIKNAGQLEKYKKMEYPKMMADWQ